MTRPVDPHDQRATLGPMPRYVGTRDFPRMHPNPPRAGERGYEPGREAEDTRRDRIGSLIGWAAVVALCMAAGWAYACGGLLR